MTIFAKRRKNQLVRNVAQPGRALCSGRRGRRFESSHFDQYKKAEVYTFAFLLYIENIREQRFNAVPFCLFKKIMITYAESKGAIIRYPA